MPSDGPHQKGDRVFVWHKDESKKKSEGVWVRRIVVSQEGAMVLVEVHRAVLRAKVRRDGDPWHDVAIPLKSDDSRSSEHPEVREEGPGSSSHDEALQRLGDKVLDRAISGYCYEREICYHSLTSGKSDFVEISPHLMGLTACTVHSGLAASEPVEFGEWARLSRIISSFILSFLSSGHTKVKTCLLGISALNFITKLTLCIIFLSNNSSIKSYISFF